MKRIIEGKTYNTDTATKIAAYEFQDEKGYDTVADVYKNRGGAFFIVNKWHQPDVNGELSPKYLFEATNREEIQRLIALESNIEILDEDALSTPPEAEEEAEPGSTVYLRLPSSLKSRIEAAARARGQSLNAWAIRCFERDLTNEGEASRERANLSLKVDKLGLSVRSTQCLKTGNILYVGDLVQNSEAELLRLPNFGRASLNKIKPVLARMGLHLGMELPDWSVETG